MSDYGQACGSYGRKYTSSAVPMHGVSMPSRGPPWTLYRCSSCKYPNRVRIAPSKAPIRLASEYCERCECNTPHVTASGSAVISL